MNSFETHWQLLRAETQKMPRVSKDRWTEVIEDLRYHNLEGFVFNRFGEKIPQPFHEMMRRKWQRYWNRNAVLVRELDWLASATPADCQPVVLKGLALRREIYADPGVKFVSDIDLLCDPSLVSVMLSLLRQRGYVLHPDFRLKANTYKYVLSRYEKNECLLLELHTRLFRNKADRPWKFVPDVSGLLRLGPDDTLVHLAGHLGFQQAMTSLSWLVDIDRYVRRHQEDLDWKRINGLVKGLNQTRSFEAVMLMCQKYLGTPLPKNAVEQTSFHAVWPRLITDEYLWDAKAHKRRYHVLKHLLRDSLRESLIYDALSFWERREKLSFT